MRIVVAPNAFKGTLTAGEAAHAIAQGVADACDRHVVVTRPVADGGDGTVAAAVAAGFARQEATVTGPVGIPVRAAFALRAGRAVLEMAEASGLRLLPPGRLAPLTASTMGTGELISAALDAGVRTIMIGAGGSATTDGGTGMATALGVRFLDRRGRALSPGGAALRALHRVDLRDLDTRISDCDITLAADVDSPLLGAHGAATVFGPQKGAGPREIAILEQGLRTLAERLDSSSRPALAGSAVETMLIPGAGAAGGLGFGAMVFLGARVAPGADLLLDLVDFTDAIRGADLVITGEGALDHQTMLGKAPAVVARRAFGCGVPVIAVCGRVEVEPDTWRAAGFTAVYALDGQGYGPGNPGSESKVSGPGHLGGADHIPAAHRLRTRTAEALRAFLR